MKAECGSSLSNTTKARPPPHVEVERGKEVVEWPDGARSRHFASSPATRSHVSVTHRISVPLERMYSLTADRFTHGRPTVR